MTPSAAPHMGDIIGTFILAIWAFLGSAMRGVSDFRDPVTGKFSVVRIFATLAAALVMGEIGGALGSNWGWNPTAVHALCGGLGYFGPAVVLQLLRNRFLGETNDSGPAADTSTKDKPA